MSFSLECSLAFKIKDKNVIILIFETLIDIYSGNNVIDECTMTQFPK